MLVIVSTALKGTVCTLPERSRSRMERMDSASTTPASPLTLTTSPTEMESSNRMKTPVITSWTSFWAPKPMARPITPAPASSGAMSTPSSESTIMLTITVSTTSTALRRSGNRVRVRALRSIRVPSASVRVR